MDTNPSCWKKPSRYANGPFRIFTEDVWADSLAVFGEASLQNTKQKNIERSTRDMLDMTTVVLTPPRPARALSCHGCCCLVKFFVVNAGCIRRRYVRLNRA